MLYNRFAQQYYYPSSSGGGFESSLHWTANLFLSLALSRAHSTILVASREGGVLRSLALLLLCKDPVRVAASAARSSFCCTRGVKGDWSEFGSPLPILTNRFPCPTWPPHAGCCRSHITHTANCAAAALLVAPSPVKPRCMAHWLSADAMEWSGLFHKTLWIDILK